MKKLVLVSMVTLLAIGSSALAWTEDFEGNPDVTSAPWTAVYSPAVVGAPAAPNPSNLSMNHPDFSWERLDMVAVGESTPSGYVEFDVYYGAGAQQFRLYGPTGWVMGRIHVWTATGGSDAEISIQTADWTTVAEAQDVLSPASWNRIRMDWDMPTESISISLNGNPLAGLQGIVGVEPGYGNYVNESPVRFDSYAWTGTSGLNQVDNIGINEPAPPFPEPATLAMLGLGGLLLRRRKRA